MQFEVWAKGLAALSVDCIVLGVFEDGEMPEETASIDSASGGLLKKLLGRGDFLWLLPAIVFGTLALPVSAIFTCQPGWPR